MEQYVSVICNECEQMDGQMRNVCWDDGDSSIGYNVCQHVIYLKRFRIPADIERERILCMCELYRKQ